MAQTPQQRRANEQFARAENAKRGKPQSDIKKKNEKPQKPPIPMSYVYVMLFVVCGSIIFQLLQAIFGIGGGFF
ncbi:hypothetical protein LTR85_004004 [Meristemomyces frigidus]|nr:hypothetical protein LTR85_004004 [Meristemomyces frigidus]